MNEEERILKDLEKVADNSVFVVCSSQEELDKTPKYTANFLSVNDRQARVLLKLIDNKDKEIERLNKEIERLEQLLEDSYKSAHPIDSASRIFYKKDKEIEELKAEIKELNNDIVWWTNRFNAVERDNERLNNIINELEKFIKREIEYCNEEENICLSNEAKCILNKLKELKGEQE